MTDISATKVQISVVFPIYNEIHNCFFWRSLELLRSTDTRIKILCVDGGSTDGTIDKLKCLGIECVCLPKSHRAQRINHGINQSDSFWTMVHHPRSVLTQNAWAEFNFFARQIENNQKGVWGGWTHTFDKKSWFYIFTSWYSNMVRADFRSIFYLDHCIFFNRIVKKEMGGTFFDEIPVFEDTRTSYRLRKIIKGVRLKGEVVTSSVRFEKNGKLKQALLNATMKLFFLVGASPLRMNEIYESKLNLNGKI